MLTVMYVGRAPVSPSFLTTQWGSHSPSAAWNTIDAMALAKVPTKLLVTIAYANAPAILVSDTGAGSVQCVKI